jgi:hypothetical protein
MGKNLFLSDKDVELEIDFSDSSKDFIVDNNDINLNIKIQIDYLMAKLASLASQNSIVRYRW